MLGLFMLSKRLGRLLLRGTPHFPVVAWEAQKLVRTQGNLALLKKTYGALLLAAGNTRRTTVLRQQSARFTTCSPLSGLHQPAGHAALFTGTQLPVVVPAVCRLLHPDVCPPWQARRVVYRHWHLELFLPSQAHRLPMPVVGLVRHRRRPQGCAVPQGVCLLRQGTAGRHHQAPLCPGTMTVMHLKQTTNSHSPHLR